MAVTTTAVFALTSIETLTGVDGASTPSITHDAFDEIFVLNASSTPPITKIINKVITLTAGAYTLDLTTETGTAGAAVDGTGLKVRAIRVKPLGANDITLAEGAANGYELWTNFTKTVATGGVWQESFGSAAQTIAAGDRQIDITGTTTQTFELTVLMG